MKQPYGFSSPEYIRKQIETTVKKLDTDRDKVPDWRDCKPLDPTKHGIVSRAVNVLSGGRVGQTSEEYKEEKESIRKEIASKPQILYVQLNPDEGYKLVGEFPNRTEAERAYLEYFSGNPYKVMSVLQAVEEGQKLERKAKRLQMMQQAKKALTTGGKAVKVTTQKAEQEYETAQREYQRYVTASQKSAKQQYRSLKSKKKYVEQAKAQEKRYGPIAHLEFGPARDMTRAQFGPRRRW